VSGLRRALWTVGTPARAALIGLIRVYRMTLSGWLGGQCRFYPTCSHYAEDAIRAHGAIKGAALATWRILRCNPFGKGGIEHVPASTTARAYDDIIPHTEGAHV
jgi:putative membrane protein insertion efficiency factor